MWKLDLFFHVLAQIWKLKPSDQKTQRLETDSEFPAFHGSALLRDTRPSEVSLKMERSFAFYKMVRQIFEQKQA